MTNEKKNTNASQLWGGRFSEKPDETFAAFNRSFDFDKRLLRADITASIAHAEGLRSASILDDIDADAITGGLRSILEFAETDPAYANSDTAEDVHSFIESRLVELIGDTGKKLHTGRSRNDQVATAFRLWLRDEIDALQQDIISLQKGILSLADKNKQAVLPGYTHLQRAQPILLAHWCLAYVEMLERDLERLNDVRKRTNILPLGAAALAGSGFPIDRAAVAASLGFEGVTANSLDAVSDRDFAIEFAGACSLIMVHLSRLAEDLIIYSSTEFGFITLSDSISTGSSLMPQKKNPDSLELIRGKAGRVFGHHAALLATMKGLPLAYNKDMQEDKEAVFDTLDTVSICVRVATIVVKNISFNESRAKAAATTGYLNATELADHLVKAGVPFRTAHEAAGKAVLLGLKKGRELNELTLDDLRSVIKDVDNEVYHALSLDRTLSSKEVIGGTSPERVYAALDELKLRKGL